MAVLKQYYNIKFPFTANNLEELFIDLNENINDKTLSELLHVILTPKNKRLRMPEFGTDLIKFIFGTNNSGTWEGIKNEIRSSVEKYVPNAKLNDIKVLRDENDDSTIIIDLDYSVKTGATEQNNRVAIKL